MQRRIMIFRLTMAAFLLFLPARFLFAQAVTGTLLGTVQDSTGAVIPDANITLTNEGTSVVNKTVSGPQGFYTFPNLTPGTYSVTAEVKGFKKLISRHDVVLVEQTTRVDLALQPGAVDIEVTVSGGQAPLVETTTSDLGSEIDSMQINNLPVNGRLFSSLMQLAPGTTPAAWGDGVENPAAAGSTAPGGGGGGAMTSVNGFPFEANLTLVDGVADQELGNAYLNVSIPFTEISEMKMETSSPTAEYGTFGGAVVNISTKTGTNALHGSLFEYNRNTDYNAYYHFSRINPPFHANQFGGAADGPIIKNKLFFSGDFQWLKEAQASAGVWSLPTAAMRTGDLSALVSNGAGPITNAAACQISAKANGLPNPAPCTASSAVTVAGTYDTVPAADIAPIAAAFLQPSVTPLPNVAGAATNNFAYSQLTDASMPQFDVRIDYPFSSNDRFFGRYSYSHRNYTQPAPGTVFMGVNDANGTNTNLNTVIGWDHTFSASRINQFRVGFNRYATWDYDTAYGTNENNALGVPNGNIASLPDENGIARMDWGSTWTGTGDPGYVPNTLGRLSNDYQLNDEFTLIKGRSDLKFGFSFSHMQERIANAQNDPRGEFKISGEYTGGGSPGAQMADWLTGALSGVWRDQFFSTPNVRSNFYGVFAQDDYRLSNQLTLNVGIRYDVYTAPTETKNNEANFVTSGPNAGLIQIASSNNPSANVDTYKLNLAPRLGAAYTPDNGKTAIRAAFGVSFFNDNFGAWGGTLDREYPFLQQETNAAPQQNCFSTVSPTSSYSGCGSFILANGLPGLTAGAYPALAMPNITHGGFVTPPAGFGVYQMGKNFRQDEAQFWNVSIERQLSPTMSLHAAYVGTAGSHLYHDYQLNQCVPPTYGFAVTSLAAIEAQEGASSIPQACYMAGMGYPYYNVAPNISTLDFRNSGGKSHYNSGQFQLEKRTSVGLTFTAAYTWSKAMDNINNPIDNYSQKQEVDTAGWQRNNYPQVLTFNYVYQLPIGRNQRFINQISPIADAVVGGWSVSGITNFRSGAPLLIGASNGALGPNGASQRANYNCTSQINPHTVSDWFDKSCFSQPIGFTLGNSGVGDVYGPHYQDWDMSLNKSVRFSEHTQLKFEADFFNIFNHTNFQNPDTNVQDGSNFGVISGEFLPRQGQLGMVLTF